MEKSVGNPFSYFPREFATVMKGSLYFHLFTKKIHRFIKHVMVFCSFQALTKIRKSLRDKKSSSTAGLASAGGQTSPFNQTVLSPSARTSLGILGRSSSEAVELQNIKEDLQAVRDEAAASKEVISVLRKQVEELQQEKDTL